MQATGKDYELYEIVCVVGRPLEDWTNPRGRDTSEQSLSGIRARVIQYDQLIESAYERYKEYVEMQVKAGRISDLISQIENWVTSGVEV